MPLSRGADWGGSGPPPGGYVLAASDLEVRRIVTRARSSGADIPVIKLTGGDLWRSLGGRNPERPFSENSTTVGVDVGSALLDGQIYWFIAHLVARRTWFSGRCWVAANSSHYGSWNLAPRAHPGDGLLDLLDSDLPLFQRLQAQRRLHAGIHVPHPGIAYKRLPASQVTFPKAVPVYLDSERVGTFRNVSVRIEESALELVL